MQQKSGMLDQVVWNGWAVYKCVNVECKHRCVIRVWVNVRTPTRQFHCPQEGKLVMWALPNIIEKIEQAQAEAKSLFH